jgi:aspartate racemase
MHDSSAPILGILGGMAPLATAAFLRHVTRECQRQYGASRAEDYPPLLIHTQPLPYHDDKANDPLQLEQALRHGLLGLERAGAQVLAIDCSTAHIFYPLLSESLRAELIDQVEASVPSIPSTARVIGLVAARECVTAGIYRRAVERRGLALAPVDWQHETDQLRGNARRSGDACDRAVLWDQLSRRAHAAGVDTLLIACPDLCALISELHTPLQRVDASQCLARQLVARWLQRRNAHLAATGSVIARQRIAATRQSLAALVG